MLAAKHRFKVNTRVQMTNAALSARWKRLRQAEKALLLYFAYTTGMGLVFGVHPLNRIEFLAINASIWIVFLFALTRAPMNAEWRDAIPYPLSLLCYRQAGWI